MRPPCISTISLEMARPRPVPPLARVFELSTWGLLEDPLALSWRDARPRIADAQNKVAVLCPSGNAHLPGIRELYDIANKVEQHLGHVLLVAEAIGQTLGHLGFEGKLLGCCQRLCRHHHRLDNAAQCIFSEVELELTGLDLCPPSYGRRPEANRRAVAPVRESLTDPRHGAPPLRPLI